MSGSATPAVEARRWGWRHPGRRAWALRDVDLRIEAGERVLLLGASGAGKSTLLLALAGLLDTAGGGEETGWLLVDGHRPAAGRAGTGIVFQDPEAQLVMARAGDDVAFGLENRCVPPVEIWPRVDEALAAVGFPYGRNRPTAALSGGEKQRLALAGALAARPRLLLLDEPTANLDADGAARLREAVAAAARGSLTVVLVEHRVEPWLPLIDRVVVLEAGRGVVADGLPGVVFGRHGQRLAADGVWVPGVPLPSPENRARPPHETLVVGDDVGFQHPGAARPVLDGVDARVASGRALALVGPNGAGKSTLALLLGGLLRPTRGSVVAGEALLAGHAGEAIARWPAARLGGRIGSVFQDPRHQFLARRVDEELLLGPREAGVPDAVARRRASELLERLRLAALAGANPYTLSGGEQRRLSVATALAAAPSALVLDEPTFGQDRRTYVELLALLAGLRDDGHGVAFASHDEHLVAALADETLRLPAGGVA